jgi:uncharacterized protein with PQ loop repeat
MDSIDILIGLGINVFLLYLLTKDAKRYNIYLSRPVKIMFLLTFTVPFIIVWYFIKRNKIKQTMETTKQ